MKIQADIFDFTPEGTLLRFGTIQIYGKRLIVLRREAFVSEDILPNKTNYKYNYIDPTFYNYNSNYPHFRSTISFDTLFGYKTTYFLKLNFFQTIKMKLFLNKHLIKYLQLFLSFIKLKIFIL